MKYSRPQNWRCPLCDEWYDPRSDRAKEHEHPEPQSGPLRDAFTASRLPYNRWIVETLEGIMWQRKSNTEPNALEDSLRINQQKGQ